MYRYIFKCPTVHMWALLQLQVVLRPQMLRYQTVWCLLQLKIRTQGTGKKEAAGVSGGDSLLFVAVQVRSCSVPVFG